VTPDQAHRCTVQVKSDGAPFLAFEPTTGDVSSYSNSLFTLDLRQGVSVAEAAELARHVNRLLTGVSATIF